MHQILTNCANLLSGKQLYDPTTTICFYNKHEPYYEFTNFYPAPISIDGVVYPSSEHYYQAKKFLPYPDVVERIRTAISAREAFLIAQQKHNLVSSGWRTGENPPCIEVMEVALRNKFSQHPKLRKILKATENKLLVEHTKNDNYWGDGGDGNGRNELGKALMRIRDEIQSNNRA